MALRHLSRRSTRLLPPLLLFLRHPFPRRPPSVDHSPPTLFSFSSLSTPLPSPNPPFRTPFHSPSDPNAGDDYPKPDLPITPVENSNLPMFLTFLSDAKSKSSSRTEALELLRSSTEVKPTKGLACFALWELRSDWEAALLAFRWAGDCISDCPWTWNLMIWVLGKHRMFDLAWRIVRKMYKCSVLTSDAMVVLIERYAAANEAVKAIRAFHALEIFKINADSRVFYALLSALCKNKNVEEAEELLLVNRKIFPLETAGFNIILDGWCNVIVDVVEAKRVWREMSNCCITPDAISYSHMICCFSKVGNLFDSLRLYDQLKKKGWAPDLVVYNSLIYVLTRENCLKEACKILEKITDEGLHPDLGTFSSMIHPLCETDKLGDAWKIMDYMIGKGIAPTLEIYHAFARAEDMQGSFKLIQKMSDVGCGPDGDTFLLIIDKFLQRGECKDALRFWTEMRRYNISPDSPHYLTMVKGLIKHNWKPKALEFYHEMKDRGFPGDPKLEKTFMAFALQNKNHWGRGGKECIVTQYRKSTRWQPPESLHLPQS